MNPREILRYIRYFNYYRKIKKRGKNVCLSRGGIIMRPEEISFGNNVFISRGFHISARNLSFGSNVMIGPNLTIECDNHVYNQIGKTMYEAQKIKNLGSVRIEDDVWIGANVTVLQNVTIGEGAIIGACSLLVKSIEPYTIAFGLPAKPVKVRFCVSELEEHLRLVGSKYSVDEIVKGYAAAGLDF